jgi:hypothetical protein
VLNSTRVVAGLITFQLGADAVLGHGSALHWLSCSRGTIAGETSPRLPNANGYCDESRTRARKTSPTAAKQKHRVWKCGTSRAFLEREQLNQENKKDPRLTPGLSSN